MISQLITVTDPNDTEYIPCEQGIGNFEIFNSGGSRISRRMGVHPLGSVDLQRVYFSVKMYAKMKELGPIWGIRQCLSCFL